MKRTLSERDLAILRQRGMISTDETAYWLDDSLIAENVFNKNQRPLDPGTNLVLETKKRVLKG